ncbi:MAG: hypothetical protein ABEJ31_03530 [Haloarculaceae archaeon]
MASKLTGWIPKSIRSKVPGLSGGSESETPTEVPVHEDHEDAGKGSGGGTLSKVFTYATLGGLGLATVGAVGRYLLDRRASGKQKDDEQGGQEDERTISTPSATIEAEDVTVRTAAGTAAVETEGETTIETDDATVAGSAAGDVLSQTAAVREYPKVAPLVGMSALVGIRLLIDWLRGDVGDAVEA